MHVLFSGGVGKKVSGLVQSPLCRVCAGLLLLLLGGSLVSTSAAAAANVQDHVVAVGDVHGDFDSLCLILRRTGLADEQNHWIGGNATLVQTGDLIDRGPKPREAMDLFMALQPEATKAGGRIVPLLGNHEVMNIMGDLRYVTPTNYAEFADNESDKRRKDAYREYAAWASGHEKWLAAIKDSGLAVSEQDWMAQHPAGFVEYRQAFSPEGKYGKWLRQHAAVAKIGDVILLHGGIPPALTSMSIEQINSQVQQEIKNFDKTMQQLVSRKIVLPFFTIREIALAVQLELLQERSATTPPDAEYHNSLVQLLDFGNWLSMRNEGPLWFRGYDAWSEEEGNQQIPKLLAAYNAKYIVVAHTVQKTSHIRNRFGATVFLIDTGMLSTYWAGGRASALDFEKDGKIIAQYLDGQEVLVDEKQPASPGKPN
jgi:hypothetical protein